MLGRNAEAWSLDNIKEIFVEIYELKNSGELTAEIKLLNEVIVFLQRLKKNTERYLLAEYFSEAWSLLGSVYTTIGLHRKAVEAFLYSFKWETRQQQKIIEYSNAIFAANYIEDFSSNEWKQLLLGYNNCFSKHKQYPHFAEKKDILRIGYISSDFRCHAAAYFISPLLENFSKERFEVYCYSNNVQDDYITEHFRSLATQWRDVRGIEPELVAEIIYNDGIDILFDLSGHTKDNCLPILAYKPAPVQICGIGYFNSTGLDTVDYFLSDPYCLPEVSSHREFHEQILRLPHSHLCFKPKQAMPACSDPPCLKNGYITFGCFNNFSKVTDAVLQGWGRILHAIPCSKLLLKSPLFASEDAKKIVQERMEKLNLDVTRVLMRPFTDSYLQEYNEVDLALDPFPYNGGLTTCEAIYMGVPVITLQGNRHGARFGYSILENVGIGELVAATEEEYVEKAVAVARDQDLLVILHKNLRHMMQQAPIMNAPLYISALEAEYKEIWRKFIHKQEQISYRKHELEEMRQELWQYITAKNYHVAEILAKKIKQVNKFEREMLNVLAGVYIETGQQAMAEKVIEQIWEKHKHDEVSYFLKMRISYMKREDDKVIFGGQDSLNKYPQMDNNTKAMIYNILGNSSRNLAECEAALKYYLFASNCAVLPSEKLMNYSNYLFNLHYVEAYSDDAMLQAHKKYNELNVVDQYKHKKAFAHKKIRVGYISPDMCRHVVVFFSYALFRDYDRNLFEVICYANGRVDEISKDIENMVDGWRNISCFTPAAAAKIIYDDKIDILFDLSGHTRNGCLPILAYKPAPIQISGIGYFDTTGLAAVDYFLVDNYTDPPGKNESYFTEKLLRLPHSHFCYTPPSGMPAIKVTQSAWHRNGYITFGSFNNFAKITDEMLHLWCRILEKIPTAHLLLKTDIFNSEYGREKVQKKLKAMGFPLDRVEMRMASLSYLHEYNDMDIALDTYPYPGGGTTCDALYMGIPVITLVGSRHGARFGYSLLKNIGLDELCAQSKEEYLQIAVYLAKDTQRLDEIHKTLRIKMEKSPLMDGDLYMQDLEQAYVRIFYTFMKSEKTEAEGFIKEQIDAFNLAEKRAAWQEVIYMGQFLYTAGSLSAAGTMAIAKAYFYNGDFQRALFWIKRISDSVLNENKEMVLLLKGECYQNTFDYVNALKAYSKCNSNAGIQKQAYLQNLLGYPEKGAKMYRLASVESKDYREQCNLYSSYLLSLHYYMEDKIFLYEEHRKYGDRILRKIPVYTHIKRRNQKKVRVGYLSADFRQHVMFYFYYPLLANYTKEDFHVTCYSLCKQEDNYTKLLRNLVDEWRDISCNSYEEAADLIYKDQIDILVDLGGHSSNNGLPILSYKPAPIQISGLGYINTTGLSAIDYFLTDPYTDPVGLNEDIFREKLLRLPDCQFCYTGRSDVPLPGEASFCKNGYITFGSFNRYAKITDEMLTAWLEIMRRVENSRLVLKSQVFISFSAIEKAKDRLASIGFDLTRIVFSPATTDYMKDYLQVDIGLDTYPYTGGGTTCDALYMGVPVISLYGDTHGSRFGYSILKNAGLEELAVCNMKAYIERAVALAEDREVLNTLHKNLRQIMLASKLMDEVAYVRAIEGKYREI